MNFIRALEVEGRPVFGGSETRATVTLAQPAALDTSVQLSTSNDAVSVPTSATISAGASSATFAVTTRAVSGDMAVMITATLDGRPYGAAMTVWRLGENDLWYERAPGGALTHFIPENATFTALCSGSLLSLSVNNQTLRFGAPSNTRLRRGHYGDARTGASDARPTLQLFLVPGQPTFPCGFAETSGSFTISELEVSRNTVRRFVASFEQHCTSNGNSVRGEVRLTNVPPSNANLLGCE